MATSVDSESAASSPTVRTFHAWRRLAVAGPTPQTHSTGSGWRNASSRSGGTAISPSGFATPLATFARNFVRATPTVTGKPTRSRTAARRRTAISTGVPAMRSIPRTSRNASSIDSPSTTGDASSNTANIARLASVYASWRGRTTIASGQSRRACRPPIAVRMPYAFAS